MSRALLLIVLGLALICLGLVERGWFLLALWLGADFVVLGAAHAAHAHGIFGKRLNGSLPLWSWMAFFPLLIYTIATWHLLRFFLKEQPHNAVTPALVVGRRLLAFRGEGIVQQLHRPDRRISRTRSHSQTGWIP